MKDLEGKYIGHDGIWNRQAFGCVVFLYVQVYEVTIAILYDSIIFCTKTIPNPKTNCNNKINMTHCKHFIRYKLDNKFYCS